MKEQRGIELLMVFALLAAGLTEPFLFNTSYKNISLLLLGAYLFGRGKPEEDRLMIGWHGRAIEDVLVPSARVDWQDKRGGWEEKAVYTDAFHCVRLTLHCFVYHVCPGLPGGHCSKGPLRRYRERDIGLFGGRRTQGV